eukprot:Em0019g261a
MKVEVKLSPIDDKRSQRNNFAAPRGRGGRGAYTSNTSSRGGGYRPRGGDSSPPPPERPSRFDEDVPRNSRDGGRSEYREARSNAYTERYADRGEKSYHSRDRDDYGPSSQGRGGWRRLMVEAEVPIRAIVATGEEITTTAVLEAATLGSRIVLLHRRTDRRPVPAAERRPRLCSPRGEGAATAPRGLVTAVVGGQSKNKGVRAEPRVRIGVRTGRPRGETTWFIGSTALVPATKGSHYHGSAPRAYQRREKELPEREYRSQRITLMPECVTDPHNAGHLTAAPRPGSSLKGPRKKSDTRRGRQRRGKRSHTPVGNAFESRFEDRTPPPPAPHYEEEQPMYPEKRSRERSPAEPSAFSPAHSDYGDLPDETMEGSGEQQPMEDVDHYPKEDEYGHGETSEAASGGYKDRRVEYEGREVREMKYEGHHETERSQSTSGTRSPIHSPIRVE